MIGISESYAIFFCLALKIRNIWETDKKYEKCAGKILHYTKWKKSNFIKLCL